MDLEDRVVEALSNRRNEGDLERTDRNDDLARLEFLVRGHNDVLPFMFGE